MGGCTEIALPGGRSSVPTTRCCEPLFRGSTLMVMGPPTAPHHPFAFVCLENQPRALWATLVPLACCLPLLAFRCTTVACRLALSVPPGKRRSGKGQEGDAKHALHG